MITEEAAASAREGARFSRSGAGARRLPSPSVLTGVAAAATVTPLAVGAGLVAAERPPVLFGGDLAVIELSVRHAAAARQLLGPYSRFFWHHPGPSWFYVLAAPYLATGERTWGIYLGVALVHALAALGIVLVAHRRGGWPLGVIAALLVLLYMRSMTAPLFRYVWNPWATLLPTALFLLLASAGAAGSLPSLGGALVVGSFLVQTHVSTAPLVIALAIVTLGLHAGWRLRGGVVDTRRSWYLTAAAAAVLVLMWLPPLVQQLTGHPGNLSELYQYLRGEPAARHSLREALSALGRELAVYPTGSYDPALQDEVSVLPLRRVLVILLYVAAALALAVASRGRRGRFPRAVGLLTLVALPVVAGSIRKAAGPIQAYEVSWITALPLPLMLGVALLAQRHLPDLRRRVATERAWRTAGLAGAAVLVAAVLGMSAERSAATAALPSAAKDGGPGVPQAWGIVSGALASLPRQPVLVKVHEHGRWPVATGLVDQLAQHGWPVSVTDDWLFMTGDQFRAGDGIRLEIVLAADADRADAAAIPDAVPIGSLDAGDPGIPGTTWLFLRRSPVPIDPAEPPVTGLLSIPTGP